MAAVVPRSPEWICMQLNWTVGSQSAAISQKTQSVLVVVPSDHVAEILIGAGALEHLGGQLELRFVAAPEVSFSLPEPCVRLALPSLATAIRRRLDLYFWYHALFRYFRASGTDLRASFKVSTLRPTMRVVHRIASLPGIAAVISAIDSYLVFRQDAAATRLLRQHRPTLVLAPGSALDSYSHMILRSAARLGIPTAMVVTHWDYFSKKGLLRVMPDRIYVWGEDMRQLAIQCNGIDPGIVRVAGVPQFQRYLAALDPRRRDVARTAFGIPPNARAVLFAGTSAPYDELAVLKRLDQAVHTQGGVETRIIYRPHPRAWPRRAAENIDVRALASVVLDAAADQTRAPGEHFLDLMAAVDGIVSPFSTMILEGALCGKPSLCVSFDDDVNDWSFSAANSAEHIRLLEGRNWLDVCRRSGELEAMFAAFLSKLGDASLAGRIREEMKRTIHYDADHYGARLLKLLREDFRFTPGIERRVSL